tara:strand:+ start:172 stop:399 length:228 start_codon:yes stop_codon:yes gene_type:complete
MIKMENNKLTQELLHSLKRIAEGIEHANKLEEAAQKRNAKFDKLQEKLTALELKSLKEKRQAGEVAAYLRNKLEE